MFTREYLESLRLELIKASPFQDKMALVVEPLLDEWGWDSSSRVEAPDRSILLIGEKPLALVVTKCIDRPQSLQNAASVGIQWVIFTDGDRFEIYATAAQKPFLTAQISDSERREATFHVLQLLSKDRLHSLDLLYAETEKAVQSRGEPSEGDLGGDLEALCLEYRNLTQQMDALSEKKSQVGRQILAQLKEKNTETSLFKVSKFQRVTVKTSLESARVFGCTVQIEDIDKEALRRLYDEGVPIPNIQQNEYIRIVPRKTDETN